VLAADRYRGTDRGRTSSARGVGVNRASGFKRVPRRTTSGRRQSGAAGKGGAVTDQPVVVSHQQHCSLERSLQETSDCGSACVEKRERKVMWQGESARIEPPESGSTVRIRINTGPAAYFYKKLDAQDRSK
jgi:hypothetical protein